jgi:lipopolysaccharide assembly outer membrane protein LptD (OstA)
MKERGGRFSVARTFCAWVVTWGLFAGICAAQTPAAPAAPTPARSDYFDVSADRSELKKINGETVLELTDNVRIIHGDVTVNADRGVSFTDQKRTQLFGHVKVVQETMTMTGDEGEYLQYEDLAILRKNVHITDRGWQVDCNEVRYSRLTGEAWLLGNVAGHDSTTTIHADRLLYRRLVEEAEAFENVEMTNSKEDLVVTGDHGTYYRSRGEALVDRNPRLVSGAKDKEPVTVIADTMRVFPDSSRATAYYKVNIIKGNTVTQCDSAMVYDDRKQAELFGKPMARQENMWMKGDRMKAFYDEQEIHRIDIVGHGEIREVPRDSLVVNRDNWMKGDSITLYLHNNDVDSVWVIGHAQSEYHPVSPSRVESNRIQGDKMFMRFGQREVDWVDVRGAASGTYRYVDLKKGETADSLRTLADSSLKYVPFESKSQRVEYAAERIQYDAVKKDLVLRKTAQVSYHGSELTGDAITYHSTNQILDASGSPTLTDKGQKIYGEKMDYDMEGGTGLVTKGNTQYEQGYYSGEHLAKVGENEMKVWNSYYTTCDLKEPHYHFAAKDMKVYPDDKVFTGPIWLYIGKTPIFALPFLANSISHGRQSGFLRPDIEFGITGHSRFIRGLGYYWATNDYTDFTFVTDFDEDVRWRLNISNRYALRYRLSGNVNYNYVRDINGTGSEWTVDAGHNQNLGERFTLNANLRFVSSDQAPQSVNTIDDVNRYIDRSLHSDVSLRKSWKTTAVSASASRVQNLNITDPEAVKVQMTAPNLSISIPSIYFGSNIVDPHGLWDNILKNTRANPSFSASYVRTEKQFENIDVLSSNLGASLSSAQRIGFLTLSPAVGATLVTTKYDQSRQAHDRIVFKTAPADTDTTHVAAFDSSSTKNDFSWNMGGSTSANFYGTFYPHIGRLRGIRHAVKPSASYAFSPARNDRPRSQSVGLSLQNALDLKIAGKDTTSTGEENVHKLSGVVIWSLATQYRPDVPVERAWSTISSGLNFNLLGLNLSLNHSVDPYTLDVLSTSATSNFHFGGSHPFGHTQKLQVQELNTVASSDTSRRDRSGSGIAYTQRDVYGKAGKTPREQLALKEGRLPWNLNLGLSYSKSAGGQVSSTMRVGWDIQLTDNWSIDYSTIYDVEDRSLNGQNFGITRDLHCWEMSFSRQVLGTGPDAEWQYYFRISLKAHQDLYGESGTRGLGTGLPGQFGSLY